MSPTPFPQLHKQQFMNLTSYRKTGQPVVTTVWFAQVGGKLYGTSQPQTGKIKRMRNNPQVLVAPSNYAGKELGAATSGLARILSSSEAESARQALNQKYGIQIKFLNLYVKIRRIQEIFWEIKPAEESAS